MAGGAGINALSFELFASELAKRPADARVRAQIHYIKGQQQPEGYWRGGAGLANNGQQGLSRPGVARPPLMVDEFTPTAFMVRALNAYGAPGEAADTKARIAKARQWLLATRATRLQEHAFRVLGLKWSGAEGRADRQPRSAICAPSSSATAASRSSRRWRQTPMPPASRSSRCTRAACRRQIPCIRSGLKFLLTTQAADGTWHVRTPFARVPAVLRERISLRTRSVDFGGGHCLRDAGDCCRRRAAADSGAVNVLG